MSTEGGDHSTHRPDPSTAHLFPNLYSPPAASYVFIYYLTSHKWPQSFPNMSFGNVFWQITCHCLITRGKWKNINHSPCLFLFCSGAFFQCHDGHSADTLWMPILLNDSLLLELWNWVTITDAVLHRNVSNNSNACVNKCAFTSI